MICFLKNDRIFIQFCLCVVWVNNRIKIQVRPHSIECQGTHACSIAVRHFVRHAQVEMSSGGCTIRSHGGDVAKFSTKVLKAHLAHLCTIEPPIEFIDDAALGELVASIEEQLPDEEIGDYQYAELASEVCAYRSTRDPDYELLAARILMSYIHNRRPLDVRTKAELCFRNTDVDDGRPYPLISESQYTAIHKLADQLQPMMRYDLDYTYRFFGLKTLLKSYLLREGGFKAPLGETIETPQDDLMRFAAFLWDDNVDELRRCYDLAAKQYYTPATPSLFNAGTNIPQMSSCFLLQIPDDSLDSIYDTLKECAMIAKTSGGIGLSIHRIRATNAAIKTTNGRSNGVVPMLRVFNDTAYYVDQCFTPETVVYTDEGACEIGMIMPGDKIITENGSLQRVKRVMRTQHEGPMVKISIKQGIQDVMVTKEHPFLVLRGQKRGLNFTLIKNRLNKGICKPEWVEASCLTKDDLVIFPIIEDSNCEDIEVYSEEDCFFYGLMIGDGHISRDGKQATITQNFQNTPLLDFCKQYLSSNGIRYTETLPKDDSPNKHRLTWSAHLGFKFNRRSMYDGDGDKLIHPHMINLPKNKCMQIVRGIIKSDGCIVNVQHGEILLEMTSQNVVENVRYILMKYGMLTCGKIRDRRGEVSSYKGITSKKLIYLLRVPKTEYIGELLDVEPGKWVTYMVHDGYLYSRITSVDKHVHYKGDVIDLEIDSVHSYVTHVGIAHNGGGKRKGAFAIYLEVWHADIADWLDLKKNTGKEERRCHDLFYGLWVCDLFMKRVRADADWSLFCPNKAPGLCEAWGEQFEELYERYEKEGRATRTIKAKKLFSMVHDSQVETGTPYILFKDAANRKSNQQNLGTIQSSNLCCEILEYTSKDEIAVCNLSSIALPKFVDVESQRFDFSMLRQVVHQCVRNLNRVIDRSYYPLEKCRRSNLRHRPMGIGVQGLADTFVLLRMPYGSDESRVLNRKIFECIYYCALEESCTLAQRDGPYESYKENGGSPVSRGILQFDMWGTPKKPVELLMDGEEEWCDWARLRQRIAEHGVRNSLLVAPMPTASTSQILGNNEAFEAFTSNMYVRRVLAGEFVVVNRHLVNDLKRLGLWGDEMRFEIEQHRGSIQDIDRIPADIKELYRTVWEIPQRTIIDMAAERGPFIDQSQSMNIHKQDIDEEYWSKMMVHAWRRGLKTGMYYLRTKPAANAISFTNHRVTDKSKADKVDEEALVCRLENGPDCVACGS